MCIFNENLCKDLKVLSTYLLAVNDGNLKESSTKRLESC